MGSKCTSGERNSFGPHEGEPFVERFAIGGRERGRIETLPGWRDFKTGKLVE